MSTITAILAPDKDGNVHVPVPEELRNGRVKIVATLEPEPQSSPDTATVLDALKELRKLGTVGRAIPDPVAWQREQREERLLPGRE